MHAQLKVHTPTHSKGGDAYNLFAASPLDLDGGGIRPDARREDFFFFGGGCFAIWAQFFGGVIFGGFGKGSFCHKFVKNADSFFVHLHPNNFG